ncbi:MAG: trypsin-like peptidase domain-containing protein, partial [Candidatus Poribacteria bacterium]|nr:trypsin-like peptidase domain-containing protein [Candidatus Poribacteria bacterium]
MKYNKKCLFCLLVLVIFLLGARTPQQHLSEKLPTLTADTATEKGKVSVVRITSGSLPKSINRWSIGAGSGFFVEPDKIVTNMHVVSSPGIIFVKLSDNETVWAVEGVAAFDIENDLVILKIAGEGVPLPLGNSGTVTKGETVYAIGYPGGGEYKLTEGIVWNSRYRDIWIQTTADTVKGNSGGPILNDSGEVIGISSRVSDFYSYAVPSDALKTLLSQSDQIEPLTKWYKQKRIRAYTYYARGQYKFFDNDDRGAIFELNKSVELDPEFAYTYKARGYMISHYAEAIGKYERNIAKARRQHQAAIKNHTTAIELDSEDDENYYERGYARSLYGKYEAKQGNTTEAQKQYHAAIEDYTTAIELDSDDNTNYNGRGQVKHLLGQLNMKQGEFSKAQKQCQAAIEDYTKAIELDPNDSSNYNGRGWTKYLLGQLKMEQRKAAEAQKHYYAAIADTDKALQLKPDNAFAYYTRGVTKKVLGEYNNAIENFNTAIEYKSDFTEAYESRGKT